MFVKFVQLEREAIEPFTGLELRMKQSNHLSNTRILAALCATLSIGLLQSYSSGPALAQDTDCNAPQTQLEMNICSQRDFETVDATLNAEYAKARQYMKSIDGDLPAQSQSAAKALLDAQRAWITYRDLACAAEGFVVKGGTMEPMIISTCKARLTQQRINDLKKLVEFN